MPYQVSGARGDGVVERLGAFASAGASHRTLAEKAFGMLHDAIVSGALRAGERLPIEDLAAATGMSPMPIREALRRLDGVGLVENVPHRGARVTELSVEDLKEVYDARLMLEVPAIALAAESFGEDEAREASDWLERLRTAIKRDNDPESLQAHTGFHFCLYQAASSRWLMRLISPLWDSAERYRVSTPDTRSLFQSRTEDHEQLLAACREHRPEIAEDRLWNHLVSTANVISAAMGGSDLYELREIPKPLSTSSK